MEQYVLDDKLITKNRKEGEQKLATLSTDQIIYLRRKCKYDLFFLAHGILGFKKLSENLHNHFCKWIEATRAAQYRLELLPRSHYKTTIGTITDSIQLTLPDIDGVLEYPYNLGSEVRILLTHEVATAAERFLYAITQHFINNPLLMALFPELIPEKGARWNKGEFDLPRLSTASEPTFDTMGVAGKSQGRHYHYIKCDDLYGAAARDSRAERESTIQWIDNLQSFLITPATDRIDFIGTRWAFDDCYAHIMEVYGSELVKYIRSCEEWTYKDGKRDKKVLIFPEQFTEKSVAILKKNRQIWNAQYSNDPREGATTFKKEWLRYYNKVGSFSKDIVIFDGDDRLRTSTDALDRIIFIDPAVSGPSGIVVTGTDVRKRIMVLEAIEDELLPQELTDLVFKLVLKWNPRVVVLEYVLFSEVFAPWWQREMQVRKRKFKVEGAKTGQKAKDVRIHGLTDYFNAGQIYICNEGMDQFLDEYEQFGATSKVHMLDALAYGPKFWRAPLLQNDRMDKAVKLIMQGQGIEGYSSIDYAEDGG